jgi:hypothetical protein
MSQDKHMDAKVALFLFPKLDRVIGKIPILRQILLGTDANLVATYFHITGPWGDPEVKPILLPASAGPTSVVLQGVPLFVKRGFKALGSLIRSKPSEPEDPPPAESEASPPANSASLPPDELESQPSGEPAVPSRESEKQPEGGS